MRAIPSPVERIVPVSRTSICSRMTSLISAARICIPCSPCGALRAALGHRPREAGELCAYAAVVYRAGDVEDDSPEQIGVHLGGRDDLASTGHPARELDDLVPFGAGERRRGPDRDACPTELLVEETVVPARDLGQ